MKLILNIDSNWNGLQPPSSVLKTQRLGRLASKQACCRMRWGGITISNKTDQQQNVWLNVSIYIKKQSRRLRFEERFRKTV